MLELAGAILFWYLVTVSIELPVLLVGLSSRHSLAVRLFAGVWLTACTYPVVTLVIPILVAPLNSVGLYYLVAEMFAMTVECVLFVSVFDRDAARCQKVRDATVVVLANAASFVVGLLV